MRNLLREYYDRRINPHYSESNHYKEIVSSRMYNSVSENREFQRKALNDLLLYAVSHVPYYRQIFHDLSFQLSSSNIFSDIKHFPILTKEIIRENFDKLQSDESFDWKYVNASGGSTGNPIEIV